MRQLLSLALIAALALTSPALAGDVTIYYSPQTNLEAVDTGLIDQARSSIDMAAYVLSDLPVMEALRRAAERGVAIRLYLDGEQLVQLRRSDHARILSVLTLLAQERNVVIKVKPEGAEWMHQKGYTIDGQALRTGAANLSASGERYQDNDLVLIPQASAADAFTANFETIWLRNINQTYTP